MIVRVGIVTFEKSMHVDVEKGIFGQDMPPLHIYFGIFPAIDEKIGRALFNYAFFDEGCGGVYEFLVHESAQSR